MEKLRHRQFSGFFLVGFLLFFRAQNCPGQTAPVIGLHENTPNVLAFKNARIVTAPGTVLEKAVLVVRDGHVEAVGSDIPAPPDAVVYDLAGKTIYPGFIDLYTHYGLPEKPAGSADSGALYWNTAVRPERSAAESFHPDEKAAQSLRRSGFTTAASFPGAGIFRGCGSLALLNDDEPSKTILQDSTAQSISFNTAGGGYPSSLMGTIALIRQTFLDARWYDQAWEAFRKAPSGQTTPEINLSLAALKPFFEGRKPCVFEAPGTLDILDASNIAREFGLNAWVRGSGAEYQRVDALKKGGVKLIIPLRFPEPPDPANVQTGLGELRHWDFAPENPARLAQAGVDFVLTTAGLERPEDFLKNLRTAVKRGLPPDKALQVLTVTPAEWLSMTTLLGTLEKGKIANFLVTDGDLFEDKTKIIDTWVAGIRYKVNPLPEIDVRGTWTLRFTPVDRMETLELSLSGEALTPEVKATVGGKTVKLLKSSLEKRLVMFAFQADSLGFQGTLRLTGMAEEKLMHGRGTFSDGYSFTWDGALKEPWKAKPDTVKIEPTRRAEFPVVYPEGSFGRPALPGQPEVLLVKNAVLWTCGPQRTIKNGDLLVKKGEIAAVGKNLSAPSGAVIIDASGKHVTPGLLDAHAHLAMRGGTNEGTHAITSETRVSDILDCGDINIYRQLAGGMTTVCTCHGSVNPIGGQNAVIKLRWGALPGEMLFEGAVPSQKFALGENVKLSNNIGIPNRYPLTRMGVEEIIRDMFQAAKDYRKEWQDYTEASKKNKNLIPPRRDLRLEPLVEILEGKRQVQCHCYRQDEILAVMKTAEEMGFKIEFFIHILEGYKVADALKKHGGMPSTFSDWWAYKAEAYDAIPYSGALMREQGLLVSFNSDDIELGRRMNLEAAKAVKYGSVPEEEALKFVTLNPARQLHLDRRIGSLEEGKDADFVIWSGSPLSSYSICEQTWIDGRRYFDRSEDSELRKKIKDERAALTEKIISKGKEKKVIK